MKKNHCFLAQKPITKTIIVYLQNNNRKTITVYLHNDNHNNNHYLLVH